jgi:hypothetical protein
METTALPNKDAEHLRALVICHYVMAGLLLLMTGFIPLHYAIMKMMFKDGGMIQQQQKMVENMAAKNGQTIDAMPFDPKEFFEVFQWFYLFGAVLMLTAVILTALSGRFIQRRVNKLFSFIVAGCLCMFFPFGTVLGVFTFILLTRESIGQLYEARV